MAKIVGAIATSHTPTIGFAFDRNKQDDPVWTPIFEAFRPIRQWLARKEPDALVFIYNDHVTSFFFDHYSAFALGIGDAYAVADEGGGPRALPPMPGHPALAQHIGASLVADEFDMAFFQDRALDHGVFSPLSMMLPHEPAGPSQGRIPEREARRQSYPPAGPSQGRIPERAARRQSYPPKWPTTIVPLQVGVLQYPIPSAHRCWKLGQALRRAIESYPEDLSVVIVATGGLSHQVHGERAGFNNPEWDKQFLDLFERDPEPLTRMTHAQYATLGGFEGAEVIMWLIMRGAMAAKLNCLHRTYYLPSMTGIATAIYENDADAAPFEQGAQQRERIAEQLSGAEQLAGTYPFTLATSVRAYRLNKFLHRMVEPAHRALFLADPETAFTAAGLTDVERDLVRRRDWRGMIHYGVIFFMLEKLGAVVGVSNLHIYAAMRGESLETFQKTRNAPGALYSVAGKDAAPQAWDRSSAKPT